MSKPSDWATQDIFGMISPKSKFLILLALLAAGGVYLRFAGSSDVDTLTWPDMSVPQRVEWLEGQLDDARGWGAKLMNGDLKRTIEGMLDAVEQNPSPAFDPVLNQAAETLVEKEYFDTASRTYEDLGQLPRAAAYAEKVKDLDRLAGLADKMEKSGTSSGTDPNVERIRLLVGLDWLSQAEALFTQDGRSSDTASPKEGPVKSREMLAKALAQLEGLPLSEADFSRAFALQLKLAIDPNEVRKIATEAEWTPSKDMSKRPALVADFWFDRAASSPPELAEVYFGKAVAALGGDETKLSAERQKSLLEVRASNFYSRGDYGEALQNAERLFPGDEMKLRLYRYAKDGGSSSLRTKPYPFPVARKSLQSQTYVYLFSPAKGHYVHQGFEERVDSETSIELVSPDPEEDVKIRFKSKGGFLYLLSFSGGWRTGFRPGVYSKANQVGVSLPDPAIAFGGEGNFKYGQFVVHEVEWEDKKSKRLSRLAIDFLGSSSGKMSDLCYGKVRYNSRYE